MFSRRFVFGFGSCAATDDPSNNKTRIGAMPLMMAPLAVDSISGFPT
jgi:hypothetical protein